jgi:hypothetical protein
VKIFTIVFTIFILARCASTAKYEAVLSSWINSDITKLTDSWGYPAGSFIAPNGNKVYIYQRGGSFTMPKTYETKANIYEYENYVYGNATTNVYGGQTLTLWCRTYFEVDSFNRIIKWSWQGNNCTCY